jgi:hypothetical protein
MVTFSRLVESDVEFLKIQRKMKGTLMSHKFVMLADYKNVRVSLEKSQFWYNSFPL